MKAAVIVFPGSNCDRDCKVAIERSTGAHVDMVWHGDTALPDGLELIVLPGVGHMVQNAAPDLVVREIEAMSSTLDATPKAALN